MRQFKRNSKATVHLFKVDTKSFDKYHQSCFFFPFHINIRPAGFPLHAQSACEVPAVVWEREKGIQLFGCFVFARCNIAQSRKTKVSQWLIPVVMYEQSSPSGAAEETLVCVCLADW